MGWGRGEFILFNGYRVYVKYDFKVLGIDNGNDYKTV